MRRRAKLGEVAELDRVAERRRAVERRQLAGDRAQQRGLAGAVRSDDADPVAALGRQERRSGHDPRLAGRPAVGVDRAPSRQVPDDEVLEPDDDLARP